MIRWLGKAPREALTGAALARIDLNDSSDWRMEAVLPTLTFLADTASRVVIISHRGRPEGFEEALTLKREASMLSDRIGRLVTFLPHFDFDEIRTRLDATPRGACFLLENLRFMREEEENNRGFAESLAGFGDYYVNDAFAVSHRANASVAAITQFLPSYGGMELEREIAHLSRVMKKPAHPLVVILGGAKAHDKLGVMRFFRDTADSFIVGGAAANTFLRLKGMNVGGSLVDEADGDEPALREALAYPNLLLPADWREEGGKILDIGEKSAEAFAAKIREAATIIWSGPMGFTEKKRFANGSIRIAEAIAANRTAFALAGGGETVGFLREHGFDRRFNFISTGGGAMLDYLAGETLPGLSALEHGKH